MTDKPAKPVSASAVEKHVYKVFPNDMNSHNTVFGGMIMAKCDRLALVVAERHSAHVCVTAAVDSIHFRAPAKGNDTLLFSLSLNRSWGSSMEIGAKVEAENSYTGETRHILSAFFTFVALDDDGKPVEVPQVVPDTEAEKRRYAKAQIRREGRLRTRDELSKACP
ncbi:acyl-CoA thioesterase [Marinobacter daepoensis]|uniref:Acyl-CoA thioesterase n=1 Tax=Marinobacter daepoensis TaxID=262077 RepID=A0ABS3BHP7_9GAMM|nr:acyl-CoA thioesterase [Marinobacter daepoensis]MBN7771022.1 acyl-CoA thioesterase [Marinobacter daepoensis]MBY6033368.1 acyl-CoA thioesterase [Marinobacter daepoensis]MBY6078884.1 acyl-CoA thioesterase [Marinobacter daepoensis]